MIDVGLKVCAEQEVAARVFFFFRNVGHWEQLSFEPEVHLVCSARCSAIDNLTSA